MFGTDLRRRAVSLAETGARRLEAASSIWGQAHAKLSECMSPARVRGLANETQQLTRV